MSNSEKPTISSQSLASKAFLAALSLGIFAHFLFFQRPLGLSVPIFIGIGILILFGLAFYLGVKPNLWNAWLVIPVILFAGLVAIRANGFTIFLNLSAVLILLLILAHLFRSGSIHNLDFTGYVTAVLLGGIEISLFRPAIATAQAWRGSQHNGGLSPRLVSLLRGLILALPVLTLFTILLISADAAFDLAVNDLFKLLRLDNIPELISRLIFTGFITWVCLGGLAYAWRTVAPEKTKSSTPVSPTGWWGFTETAVILGSINGLFAAFVAVQFRYFFGGQNNISIAGFTYAEYTRRGFVELVIVATFTLAICLILQSVTRRESRAARLGFEGLVILLIILTGIILVSAFERLRLYEDVYGWTQLRLYVHVFMVWLGALLVVFIFTVHLNRPRFFIFGFFLACLAFVIALNILNTDELIARKNIARYASSGKLDAVYLATLSEDATPELLWLLQVAKPDDRQIIGSSLHYRLNQLEVLNARAGWPGWNWSRSRALTLLKQAQIELQRYEPSKYYWNFPIE